ncbi:toxin biosynthesis protein [Stemphylium lycopersici]|nr:toxin biosynthesis protein [Stemphylium lycopersici]
MNQQPQHTQDSLMIGHYMHPEWTLSIGLYPATLFLSAVIYALFILAYPPSRPLTRKLSILILSVPTWFAFRNANDIVPSYELMDTFMRFCLIWFVHMSYEVCVLEFTPVVRRCGKGEIKDRFMQAYKVLWDRNHTQVLHQQGYNLPTTSTSTSKTTNGYPTPQEPCTTTDKKTDEPMVHATHIHRGVALPLGRHQHSYTRWQLVRHHLLKALLMYSFQTAYAIYEDYYSPLRLNPRAFVRDENIRFFRRMPASLHYKELYYRTEEAFEWNIGSMWLYEGYHSICAVLWVGIGLDGPEEWSLNLFGPLAEAWSVRRYWNKYWHNFVYHSFSGHFKCVTRGWLGMRRGAVATRLLENSLVFVASGLMHSLVRWQHSPTSDVWAITFLYAGQMIPIVIEGVVVHYWRRVRKSCGFRDEAKWLNVAEYAVGYSWSIGWQVYSVSKYYITRRVWTDTKILKRYEDMFEDHGLNETDSE